LSHDAVPHTPDLSWFETVARDNCFLVIASLKFSQTRVKAGDGDGSIPEFLVGHEPGSVNVFQVKERNVLRSFEDFLRDSHGHDVGGAVAERRVRRMRKLLQRHEPLGLPMPMRY